MLQDYLAAILRVWFSQFGGWAAVVLSIVGYLAFGGNNVPPWMFWLLAAVCIARTTFIVWRDEKRKVIQLTTPKLEILLEHHPSYVQDDPSPGRLIRIGIKNISGRSIKNVEVDVVEVDPSAIGDFIPFTLQNTHYNYGRLDPGGVRMVDLIYKAANQQKMIFHPKLPLPPIAIDTAACVVTVWAHGKNCEARRRFTFSVDHNGFVAVTDYKM